MAAKNRAKKTSQKPAAQKLRIIGGTWRSRVLDFPDTEGLRPTGARIRETLFNWLNDALPGADCLDLCSGSGALGFEALSRGAKSAILVDNNAEIVAKLRENANKLNAPGCTIIHQRAQDYLKQVSANKFDIVFIDPPFSLNLWPDLFSGLESNRWLNNPAYIYVETPRDCAIHPPPSWSIDKEKVAGNICYRLLYSNEAKIRSPSTGEQ